MEFQLRQKLRNPFFKGYLLILATISIVFFAVYLTTYRIIAEDTKSLRRSNLAQTVEQIDIQLKQVEDVIVNVADEPSFRTIARFRRPFDILDVYKLHELQFNFPPYSVTNNLIDDIYVYFANIDIVLFYNHISFNLQRDYPVTFRYSGISYDQWKRWISGDFRYRQIIPPLDLDNHLSQLRVITMLQSFPVSFVKNPVSVDVAKGCIVVQLDEQRLLGLLAPLLLGDGSYVRVLSRDGAQLMSSRSDGAVDATIRGGDPAFAVLTYTSRFNGWRYELGVPKKYFLERANRVANIFRIVMAFSLILGAFVALYFSRRNMNRLARIGSRLRLSVRESRGDPFRNIESALNVMISDGEALKRERDRLRPFMSHKVLERLLREDYIRFSDLEDDLRYIDFPLANRHYQATLIGILELPEDREMRLAQRLLLKNAAAILFRERRLPGDAGYYWLEWDESTIALLLTYPEALATEECREQLGLLVSALQEETGQSLLMAAGEVFDDPDRLGQSYRQAAAALGYRYRSGSLVLHQDLPQEGMDHDYPAQLEVRLTTLLLAGDAPLAMQLWQEMIRDNTEARSLDALALNQLVHDFMGTVYRLRSAIKPADDASDALFASILAAFNGNPSLQQLDLAMQRFFRDLCTLLDSRKKSHNIDLSRRILAYMDQNLGDWDMGLTKVARTFAMSEHYLSSFFKEQTGANFQASLSRMRLERARNLIETTELTLTEIGSQVGYQTINSFTRAFKKEYGISPSLFRRNLIHARR